MAKVTRRTAYPAKVQAAKKKSTPTLKDEAKDVWRLDMQGNRLGKTKRQMKPVRRVLNQRYLAARRPVSSFHPENYSTGELEAIARGRGGEAWSFTMMRSDVPVAAQNKALAELERRMRRR